MKKTIPCKFMVATLFFLFIIIGSYLFVYADDKPQKYIKYDFYNDGSGKDITSDEVNPKEARKVEDNESNFSRFSNWRTSQTGVDLIKEFEGCRLTAYKATSSEQYYTIGYGHYGADVYPGMTITQQQAENLLKSDLIRFENNVNDFLSKYDITIKQNQFDALVSFTYNLGNIWVKYDTFDLKTYLINGVSNYTDEQITAAFTRWNKAGGKELDGLTRRRKAEAALFLHGNTDTCSCSEAYAGYYICTASSALNIRNGHGGSVIGTMPANAVVYVSKADGQWAHVTYNGIKGCSSMKYLKRQQNVSKIKGLTITHRSYKALEIAWKANNKAKGYVVEQYRNGKWVKINQITSNKTTTCRVSKLAASRLYKFRVRAYVKSGKKTIYGKYVYVAGKTRPLSISGVKVVGRSKNAIKLKWNKNSSAEGYSVEQYMGNNNWIAIKRLKSRNLNTYTIGNLSQGTKYRFRVRAYVKDENMRIYSQGEIVSGNTLHSGK